MNRGMQPRPTARRSTRTLAALLGFSAILSAGASEADTYTWTGNLTNLGVTGWSSSENWEDNLVPVSGTYTELEFGALGSNADTAVSTQDILNPFTLESIDFDSTAPAYTLGGGALNMTGGIFDNSANTETINNAITFAADQGWQFSQGSGGMVFGGAVNNNGYSLEVITDGSTTNTLSVALSGTGGLTTVGNATLILTGASSYTGTTTISSPGGVQVGTGGTSGSLGTGNIVNNGVLTYDRSDNITLSTISGGGTLVQAGSGTLTLSGTNTMGGTTVIAGGLAISGGASVNDSTGGLFADSGSGNTHAALITLGAGSSITTQFVYLGYMGAGSLTQTGGALSSADEFVLGDLAGSHGSYSLSGGSLSANTIDIGSYGTGTLTQTGGSITTTANFVVGGGQYSLSGTGSLSTHLTDIGGSGDVGVVNQTGGTFTTNGSNLYIGGSSGSGTYTLAGGTLTAGAVIGGGGATFHFAGGTLQAGANSTAFLQGMTTADVGAAGAVIDLHGYIVTASQTLTSATAGGTPDGGLTVLDSVGGGALTLKGANSYTGGTTFQSGTVDVDSYYALGSSGPLSFTGGTLQYSDGNQTDYSRRFSQAANQAYSIDLNGQTVNFATPLTSNGGSLRVVDSAGGGRLTLNGANTYTGTTFVSGGTLALNGSINGGNVAVSTGGTLAIGGTSSVTVGGANGTMTVDGANASPPTVTVSGTASLNVAFNLQVGKASTGSFTQTGGLVSTNGGFITLGEYAGSTGTYTLSNGTIDSGYISYVDGTGTFNLDGGTLAVYRVVNDGSGANTFNFNGGTLQPTYAASDFFAGVKTAAVQAGGAIINTNGQSVTMAQTLTSGTASGTPDGGLIKYGAGALTLTAANTYTGVTIINAGALLAANTSGSATGTGRVMVNAGGTLGGNGIISGAVTVAGGGTLSPSPGLSPTRLTLGSNLTLNSSSTLAVVLGGTSPDTGYDQVQLAGQLTLAGNLSVSTVSGFKLAVGQTFVILDDTGTTLTAGFFANTTAGAVYTDAAGDTFLVNYLANADGGTVPNDVSLTVVNVVPEPRTWQAVVTGSLALLALACKRRLTI